MMKGLVCKVLKGIFVTGWLCAASDQVQAATYYAGPAGISSGACTADTAPYCELSYAISKLANAGDVLEVHAGTYSTDRYMIRNKNGALGNHIIIQGYHYGLAGAERPIIEGAASTTWTRCVNTSNVECVGLPTPVTDYWYTTGTGNQNKSFSAFYANGRGTYQVTSKTDMTNAHAGFVARSCTTATWIACATDSECPSGDTCSVSTIPEVDSYSEGRNCDCTNYIVTRWCKNGANCQTPGKLLYNNNGYGFDIGPASYVTIRGFYFRNFRRGAIAQTSDSGGSAPTALITLDDNIFSNSFDLGSGYQIDIKLWPDVTISNSFFSHAASESIHTEARSGGTKLTITNNYIRSNGDVNVLGPALGQLAGGTPEGMTLSHTPSIGNDYSDSIIDGNYINNVGKQGIIFENNFHGTSGHPVTVSNNIINGTARSGFKFACDEASGSISYMNLYNNILVNANLLGSYAPVEFAQGISTCLFSNINFYNNTIISRNGIAIRGSAGTGLTSMVFRNNILYFSGDGKLLDFPASSTTNKFSNNIVYTTSNSAGIATWRSTTYNCTSSPSIIGADLDGDAVADGNQCANPSFVNIATNDYHTNLGSPAINLGTATGMPSTHTTSITNTIVSSHGLPSYDDGDTQSGSAWDAGATEYVTVTPTFLTDGSFELGDFNLGGAESTSPCTDVPAGTGGRATVFADPNAPDGSYAVKLEQYFIGNVCTPPALPGFKFPLTGLAVGNNYILNGYMKNPTAIDTLYPLLICMDDQCNDSLPLGDMGMPELGLCVGGTHVGNSCGPDPGTETCPGGTCEPRAGYYPFSSIFQARSSSEFLRFIVLSGSDSLYPRYIYLDNISISGSCVLTP